MKVTVPVIVKDPEVADFKGINPTEKITIEEEIFLDGPISPRVAILDFDPESGELAPGVPFVPPGTIKGAGSYRLDHEITEGDSRVPTRAAAVSVFGAVHKALRMFEEKDALGRQVEWAFDAPQLLVVPRAGDRANAYYERESHSLQFFRFPADDGRMIFAAHSQDIVAHETAHAVLDGVAPDLYETISPQGLAIHEAVADLTSLLCAFRCRELASRILEQMGGDLNHSTAFSGLARQFGAALDRGRFLRDLFNTKSIHPDAPEQDRVDRGSPHDLSEVLSGAFYRVLVRVYDELRRQYGARREIDPDLVAAPEAEHVQRRVARQTSAGFADRLGAQSKALFVASERLKRTLFRGLDYLPPGDVTFADLARAVLAADEASHPQSKRQRQWMIAEFIKRGIAPDGRALEVETNFDHPAVADLDLAALVRSDYVAYDFAEKNRDLLGIPRRIKGFEVRPRLDVTKRDWHRDGPQETRECFFKVAWTEMEKNVRDRGLPDRRRWTAGTTLVMSWDEGPPTVRALLTTRRTRTDRTDTDRLLLHLLDKNLLKVDGAAYGIGGIPLERAVAGEILEGALRIKGMGRTLHITEEGGS
ncbi:MAG: hypothetical protein GY838_10000 [bacterium]|nr:hypothetical protein [bacterium]